MILNRSNKNRWKGAKNNIAGENDRVSHWKVYNAFTQKLLIHIVAPSQFNCLVIISRVRVMTEILFT